MELSTPLTAPPLTAAPAPPVPIVKVKTGPSPPDVTLIGVSPEAPPPVFSEAKEFLNPPAPPPAPAVSPL